MSGVVTNQSGRLRDRCISRGSFKHSQANPVRAEFLTASVRGIVVMKRLAIHVLDVNDSSHSGMIIAKTKLEALMRMPLMRGDLADGDHRDMLMAVGNRRRPSHFPGPRRAA